MKVINWKYKPSGNCPIQSEGYFLGYYFYFRSRWEQAIIEFAKTENDWEISKNIKWYTLWNTEKYKAGWLNKKFCQFLIYFGCLRFLLYLLYDKAKEKIM